LDDREIMGTISRNVLKFAEALEKPVNPRMDELPKA
jgi:hypothetical protein